MLTSGEEMDGRCKLPSVKARKVCETISPFTSAVLHSVENGTLKGCCVPDNLP